MTDKHGEWLPIESAPKDGTEISTSAYFHGEKYGKKFSVRKDATKRLRVWRIK